MSVTKIDGQDLVNLIASLNNPIGSLPSGAYKKVTDLKYNPGTGDLLISYEE